jgi:hypothetical protein
MKISAADTKPCAMTVSGLGLRMLYQGAGAAGWVMAVGWLLLLNEESMGCSLCACASTF